MADQANQDQKGPIVEMEGPAGRVRVHESGIPTWKKKGYKLISTPDSPAEGEPPAAPKGRTRSNASTERGNNG